MEHHMWNFSCSIMLFYLLCVCFLKIEDLVHSLKPVNVKVESVLIVVGSLFKQIGTPVVS
jgi:hypothetical protein